MELKQLHYFVTVAELGSFTQASAVLDIAQPALSRQVRRLEVELRQALLLRNGRGVTLTEAGKLLLEQGRGVLYQIKRTQELMAGVKGSLAGHVVIGLPPSLSRLLTVPLAHECRKVMPDATFSVCEGLSVNMQEALRNGLMDIALLYLIAPSPELDLIPIRHDPVLLIERKSAQPATEAISLRELAQKPLVIPSRPHSMRMLIESSLAAEGLHPLVAYEIDSVPAILELVADGFGCATLSHFALQNFSKSSELQVRTIGEPELCSRLVLAISNRRAMTLTQQKMIEVLQSLLARRLAAII